MMIDRKIKISGAGYHKAKLKFKAELKSCGFGWCGSLDNPKWASDDGEVTAEFLRENDVTKEATIRINTKNKEYNDRLSSVLLSNGGFIISEVADETPTKLETVKEEEPMVEVSAAKYMVIQFMRKKSMKQFDECALSYFINYCMLDMGVPPTIVYAMKDEATMEHLLAFPSVGTVSFRIDPWENRNVSCEAFEKAKKAEIDRLMHKYATTQEEKDQIWKEFREMEARREEQKKQWKAAEDASPEGKTKRSIEKNFGAGPDPLGLFGVKITKKNDSKDVK